MKLHLDHIQKVSWCATSSKEDEMKMQETIGLIKSQTILPYEILVTYGGNISQGRNRYLKRARGEIIAVFDEGCVYLPDWTEKLLKTMKKEKVDIVFGIVRPAEPEKRIQKFCMTRLPDYDNFSEQDWNNFVPSNRQVLFKREIINKLGLLPEQLWRGDDTYWFWKARELGLKFAPCPEAVVYWKMKESLKSYLKTVYNDNKCNYQFGIKSTPPIKRQRRKISRRIRNQRQSNFP